jgi:plastocyanin
VIDRLVTLSERRRPTTSSMTAIAIERPVRSRSLSWGTLLRITAVLQALGLGLAAGTLGDAEAGAIAIATIVMLVIQRFRRTVGAVLLALLFADTAFFTAAAALSNLLDQAAPLATIGPAALAATALTGLLASIANVWQRGRAVAPSRSATAAAFVAAAAIGLIAIASVVSARGTVANASEALRLEIKGAKFSTDSLTATSRTVTVAVTNHDLFWHTFTIGALGVDLRVPVGDEKSVTFTAAPGTYQYICGIPGHASFMRGVLTVP